MITSHTSAAALALIGATLAAGAAQAAEVHGKITKINPAAQKLTIARHVYRFGPQLNAASLAQGQVVRIEYRWSQGHREAVRVLPADVKKSA